MRHGLLVLLVGTLLLTAPSRGAAQSPEVVASVESPSPFVSGFLEYWLPTAGYAYAGDWKRGLLPNAVRMGGMVLFIKNLDGGSGGQFVLGLFSGFGGTVWAVVGASKTASRRSHAPRPIESGLVVSPSAVGGIEIGYRWVRPRSPLR